MRVCLTFFIFLLSLNPLSASQPQPPPPARALDRLMAGNQRYMRNMLRHPNQSAESRQAVVKVQKPFAIVLGCSDSRVAPEIIFDQGIGDLFVVRVAGNVAGPLEVDSIEYAVSELGTAFACFRSRRVWRRFCGS